MDSLDIIFAGILLLSAFRGYSKGFLRTAVGMASPVIGILAGLRWAVPVGVGLEQYVRVPEFMRGWVAVPGAFRF